MERQLSKLTYKVLPVLNEYSVLAGFLIPFGFFFIRPVFLNPEQIMKFFMYVPVGDPIGLDLNQMLGYCEALFIHHESPYIGNNLYPPLATVLFGPFLTLDQFTAYKLMVMISVAAYVTSALIIPLLLFGNSRQVSIIQLLFITGLFSYGFQFELERGQFNLFAFSLALLAIYLFHFKPRFRLLSYTLLTLSVQLKIFPILFVVMLVDDWTDLKTNIKRIFGITLINVSLLFVLGYQIFQDFLQAISKQALEPHITMTNHSIKVFVELVTRKTGFRSFFTARGIEVSQIKNWAAYSDVSQILLQLFAIGCLLTILLKVIRMRSSGFDPYLLASCTLLMLLLPSVSNDYKLPLLTGPLGIVFQRAQKSGEYTKPSLMFILLTFIGSSAYSSTLFSYTNKPLILDNNAPALLVILLVITIMSAFRGQEPALRTKTA